MSYTSDEMFQISLQQESHRAYGTAVSRVHIHCGRGIHRPAILVHPDVFLGG